MARHKAGLDDSITLSFLISFAARPTDHEIVAMNHFGTAANPEKLRGVGGRTPFDLVRIDCIVGDETAADLMRIRAAHDDGVAPREMPIDPGYARRK